MFIVLNDGKIIRTRRRRFLIGRAPDVDLRLDSARIEAQQCELTLGQERDWHIRNLGGSAILVNGHPLPKGESVDLVQPCMLGIGQYTLELRESSASGAISQRLRSKLFA